MGDWKLVFEEQRAPGNMIIWANPFTKLASPKSSISGRTRTSEPISHRTSITTDRQERLHRPAGRVQGRQIPRNLRRVSASQKAPSFSVDQIVADVQGKIAKLKAAAPPGTRNVGSIVPAGERHAGRRCDKTWTANGNSRRR